MICRTCIQRATALSRRSMFPSASTTLRTFSSTIAPRQAAVVANSAAAPAAPPATGDAPAEESTDARSSCPTGTVLNGLNYFKGKTDPVAKPDSDYPEWLWACLDVTHKADAETDDGAGDEYSKSKKQRRLAAKRQRNLEAQMLATGNLEMLAPKIPLQQQSINLPGSPEEGVEGAVEAIDKREELRRAMRKERKAKIKEANYLKSM
ncbi:mitochondrial ribosomal protein L37-domain-containing protein [Coniella lustricola]|uniref:Large ribosomal subunit protein mL54 n=1 Tax=Coniella lustricola TaxID=2025994 RepID=A0A2T3AIN6_9PEZI|nr:mitochondrial ribosomal protein L37-domain-containing protein [Coniella lustricola]